MSNDKSYVSEKKAAQILNRVLRVEPRHPGVTHYLIHSYDYPALAHLALPAARNYAENRTFISACPPYAFPHFHAPWFVAKAIQIKSRRKGSSS